MLWREVIDIMAKFSSLRSKEALNQAVKSHNGQFPSSMVP